MIYTSPEMEHSAALNAAAAICAAMRTAPKTKGVDVIRTCVVTGQDKERLAIRMRELSEAFGYAFFKRDADGVDAAEAVVIVAAEEHRSGLGKGCSYCHFADCDDCAEKSGLCAFNAIDVGIALGSAAAMAADLRVDSRIMFSVGRAAQTLGLPCENASVVLGLPISIRGKNPYFDRKPKG